jgi:hypothetical protein
MTRSNGSTADEARIFCRFLVGREVPEALVDRYESACARLFPDPPDAVDAALLDFVRRHPWSVGALDAATGFLRRESRLRARLLVMAAVLEATPTFADEFLPRSAGRGAVLGRLVAIGCAAVARLLLGIAVYGALRVRT